MKSLNTRWTKNLKDLKDKKNFEVILRNNTVVNTRLVEILEEMKSSTLSVRYEDYDSASWAYRQADQNGYRRALDDILALFKF